MSDITKCAGQAPDGTQKCAYRETCYRYTAPVSEHQWWEEFYKAGDDCPQYLSIPKEAA